MVTVGASPANFFAEGGLSGSVAVAVGALVVVLAIVLVFIMVLRSNGAARKTASGLGFDAQHGPLGQPQPDAASPWQRQAPQQQPGWQQDGEFAQGGRSGANPPVAGAAPAGWGQAQDFPAGPSAAAGMAQGQGAWGGPQGAAPGGWNDAQGTGASQGGGQGRWNDAPQQHGAPAWPGGEAAAGDPWSSPAASGWNGAQAAPSRPAAPAAAPWDMPAASAPGAAGQAPWGSPGGPSAAPWDAPAPNGQPAWGSAPGAGGAQPDWNMEPSQPSQPSWGAPAGPAAPQDWNAAPPASRQAPPPPAAQRGWDAPAGPSAGAGYDGAGYGEDKTRVVRPNNPQRPGMIVVRQGKEPGRIYEVRKDRLTIGRSRESDIFLEDLAVSRLHTTVGRDENGRYLLRDENSANGTYVNGQRVAEHVLEEGDEIQVGQTVLSFVRR